MRCRSSPTSAPPIRGALIDWVVEPAFAPLLRARRRHRRGDRLPAAALDARRLVDARRRARDGAPSSRRLRRERYDAVIDLQGLTKSALIARLARGPSYGLANRTDGASHEAPARWLVDHAIRVEPHSHALDRSRELVARGARHARRRAAVVRPGAARAGGARAAAHRGPHPRHLARRQALARSELDRARPAPRRRRLGDRAAAGERRGRQARAQRIAAALGGDARSGRRWTSARSSIAWRRRAGAIGVDSGPSHIAVALGLPHVQIYNFPTAWRTGPQARHGARPSGVGRRRAGARRSTRCGRRGRACRARRAPAPARCRA